MTTQPQPQRTDHPPGGGSLADGDGIAAALETECLVDAGILRAALKVAERRSAEAYCEGRGRGDATARKRGGSYGALTDNLLECLAFLDPCLTCEGRGRVGADDERECGECAGTGAKEWNG